jgi:hypothetical protein
VVLQLAGRMCPWVELYAAAMVALQAAVPHTAVCHSEVVQNFIGVRDLTV